MSENKPPGLLDRLLGIFGDVHSGEGATVILMLVNVFLLLVGYYVLKTVREPLILIAGGAQLKSYAAAAQALALIVTCGQSTAGSPQNYPDRNFSWR